MSTGHFQEFEDEYLEMMYQFFEKDPDAKVRTGDLAEALRVTPASTTEMIQRLAGKGYLEYIPYKGAMLTPKGLAHGKMMKRRHRLAEVLLAHLPFDGNQHATACRLEHAIDDDLEVALTLYLNNPTHDPSGTEIPEISDELGNRVKKSTQNLIRLSDIDVGAQGEVQFFSLPTNAIEILEDCNLAVGEMITKVGHGRYSCKDNEFMIDGEFAKVVVLKQ